ncbi:MAG: ADP-forming succinate--CoA ligase subunit beta [Deltaproteobacteria bacterium]|jgi:succinyl-CoA synthetase beta subunit|nr:ADP-forming succinate--CoA ligase subunit beta [Deltaproteobacteria bacterium]MBW2499219.1 ADP-forming succinate--CoA ligase subunit beta [Deltaproteobacteria bacterium]
MNVHEYQAKGLFREYGVAVPAGELATTPEEAERAAKALATPVVVVKAQVHAGGRGKGGGVKLAKSPAEAKTAASEILGMTLHTPQTPPEGKLVRKVYIEAGSNIEKEYYLAILFDRAAEKFALVASTEGGMEIEVVAEKTPDKILTQLVDPNVGLREYQVRDLGFRLGLTADQVKKFVPFVTGLFRLFLEKDCSQVEINPLVLTAEDDLFALDGKLNFDDNALYRHPEIADLRDPDEEDARERAAKEIDLAYVGLDGNIGCMVNGAGLAMATLDMINYCGGKPANFLDAGGGADKEKVKEAFKLILRDENVEAILVNIFGGIVRCDLIAEGVVAAAADLGVNVPLVVRLQGTMATEGREILAKSDLNITPAETLKEAGELAVAAVKGAA